jgi:predicted outer membrane repeat protein
LSAIAFEDAQSGVVVGVQPNRAARTEDGGATWTEISIPTTPQAGLIEYIPGTEDTYVILPGAFLGGSRMGISRDGGTSWTSPNIPNAIKCLQFISPTLGFAGGTVSTTQNTGLFKWTGDLSDPLYVNHAATGADNGTSWEDAFIDLQSALAAAETTSQIWVAQGTYKASSLSMLPDETFFEDAVGVKLYGGFEGVEIYVGDRDIEENPTILSADLMGDDLPNNFEDNRSDNAYHVLTSIHSNNSVLDGFTISGGHALLGDGSSLDYIGGGVVSTSDLVVNNCVFIHNQGAQGGAMSGQNDVFTVTNSLFKENKSTYGGLLIVNGTGEPFLISGNRFEGNTATEFGGGMTAGNCEAIIEDNVFESNSTDFSGGGLFVFQNDFAAGGKVVSLSNNQFLNNSSATRGGGLTCNNFNTASVFNITDCYFEGNTTGFQGGAASLFNGTGSAGTVDYTSSFFLEVNTFVNNTAPYGGGVNLANNGDEVSFSILSSTFENNTASDNGGAINAEAANAIGIDLQMENLNIIGNSAAELGGGLYLDVGLSCQLLNSVISENSANEGAAFYLQSSSAMSAENILIAENTGGSVIHNNDALHLVGVTCAGNQAGLYQDGAATVSFQNTIMANFENYFGITNNHTSLGGNLSSDATLTAAFIGSGDFSDLNETDPLLDENFIPTSSSPCIDAGNPNAITVEVDLAGNERFQGTQIDIGAHETPFVTSVDDLANFINIEVFPNPFLNEIQVTSDTPILSLELLDIRGRLLVKQLNSSVLQGLNFLPTGTYLLKIGTVNGVEIVKTIKG